jgi:23S rRNA (adenine2503-C2)-methyltransferase
MTAEPPRPDQPQRNLLDLDLPALEVVMRDEFGEPPYRARQVFHAIYQEGLRDYGSMTTLPRPLRQRLAGHLALQLPSVHQVRTSADGSRKYVLELSDGKRIESVYLVDDDRLTFCLSSQVGCAFGCDFCLTARMGLVRQMTPGEILGQVLRLADEGGHGRLGYNLVFMGMGEPLHNFDALAMALNVLLSPKGLNLSYRRITVSTVGDVNGIRLLAGLERRPRLAVSLNAAEDSLRSRMMPVNRAHSLSELLGALERYPLRKGERITFEYVLLGGVNDSPDHADALARWVRRVPSKVNLIPFNEATGLPYVEPAAARVETFRDRLLAREVATTVRWSRGRDIQAACGQLAVTEVVR